MTEEKVKTLRDIEEDARQAMEEEVESDNPLKELFVNYVGHKFQPENGKVTVELCIRALAEEFPEFLAPVAEQNFMLGYYQCERDIQMIVENQRIANEAAAEEEEILDVEFEEVEVEQ